MEGKNTKSVDADINTTNSNYTKHGHEYQSFQDGNAVIWPSFLVIEVLIVYN